VQFKGGAIRDAVLVSIEELSGEPQRVIPRHRGGDNGDGRRLWN
jgi:hypothetical protein